MCRLPSPSTTRAYSIWPASIIVAASCMPLTKPRQALDRSKFMQADGRPSWWWTATALLGSRWSRHTEVSMSSAILAGSTPDSAIALAPAMAAASAKLTSGPHHRRSWMPATLSSIPARKRTRE